MYSIGLSGDLPSTIRYQPLHRLASAIIEAKRFNARYALMILHSFSQPDEWFSDYGEFLELFGPKAHLGELTCPQRLYQWLS